MAYEQFIEQRLNKNTQALVQQANDIIAEYQAQDIMALTNRQLFYQFVSRDLLANTLQEYARLNRAMRVGRDTGAVDWDAIEDRTGKGSAGPITKIRVERSEARPFNMPKTRGTRRGIGPRCGSRKMR
jgi:hypothetical protein